MLVKGTPKQMIECSEFHKAYVALVALAENRAHIFHLQVPYCHMICRDFIVWQRTMGNNIINGCDMLF